MPKTTKTFPFVPQLDKDRVWCESSKYGLLDDTAVKVPRTLQVVDALTFAQPVKTAFSIVAVTTSMVERLEY